MNKDKWDFPVRKTRKPDRVKEISAYLRQLEKQPMTPEEMRALFRLVRGGK